MKQHYQRINLEGNVMRNDVLRLNDGHGAMDKQKRLLDFQKGDRVKQWGPGKCIFSVLTLSNFTLKTIHFN
jgi:hypothetical protein